MPNKYQIIVDASINDTKLRKQLENLSKSYKIKIDASSLDRASTQVKKLDRETAKAAQSNTRLASSMQDVDNNTRRAGQSIGDITVKLLKWGAVAEVIGLVRNSIFDAVEAVFELDKALTEFKKVSDLSGESLSDYSDQLNKLGKEVGRTRTEMVQAAAEAIKAGYSEEEALTLSKIATMYQNVADAEISAGDSMTFIVSQLKAFNIPAEEAVTVINQINEVSNKMSVSSVDMASALAKTSSAMSVLGNSSYETLGLVAAGVELMPKQAGKVSRGLRTIGNNIADMANGAGELEFAVGNATKKISLFDEKTGEMKSTYKVFEQINKSWENMSKAQQQALAIDLAG